MPFSSGVYTVAIDFATEAASPPIEIAKLDQQMQDIATALSTCMLRDGTGTPTAAIPFGSQDITGVKTLTISDTLADNNSLILTKAGSKIALARSSDGTQHFYLGSESVGGSSFSMKNDGGVGTEIQLGGAGNIIFKTNGLNRLTVDSTGAWTIPSTTAANTATATFGSATAITAGGAHATGIAFTSTVRFGIFCGSGVPTITVAKGSLYLRSDGAVNARVYVATDSAGTWTTWNTAA